MKNEVLELLSRGENPVVRINSSLRSDYDWDGYLAQGMLARIVSLKPAPGWRSGADEVTFKFSEFSGHNRSFEDSVSRLVCEEAAGRAERELVERVILLEGSELTFCSLC